MLYLEVRRKVEALNLTQMLPELSESEGPQVQGLC